MDPKKRRQLIIATITFLALCLVLTLIIPWFHRSKNPYGEAVDIANLDEYTSGQPTDQNTLNWIRHALYQTISLNLSAELDPSTLNDIYIRADSFSQTYTETTQKHTVTFIVDIKSLGQSYAVSYQWAKNPNDVDEYGTLVRCLSPDQLVYGNFNCHDLFSTETGSTDPIAGLLPYASTNFKIEATDLDAAKPQLKATIFIFLYETSYDDRYTKAEQVKPQVTQWIRSNGINPDNYDIEYIVELN